MKFTKRSQLWNIPFWQTLRLRYSYSMHINSIETDDANGCGTLELAAAEMSKVESAPDSDVRK